MNGDTTMCCAHLSSQHSNAHLHQYFSRNNEYVLAHMSCRTCLLPPPPPSMRSIVAANVHRHRVARFPYHIVSNTSSLLPFPPNFMDHTRTCPVLPICYHDIHQIAF
jgi:hypothetical protein